MELTRIMRLAQGVQLLSAPTRPDGRATSAAWRTAFATSERLARDATFRAQAQIRAIRGPPGADLANAGRSAYCQDERTTPHSTRGCAS